MMLMKRRVLLILLLSSTMLAFGAKRPLYIKPARLDIAPRDTTDFGEDNDDVETAKPSKDKKKEGDKKEDVERTGFDALQYTLSRRYRATGEEFGKRWDDHLFVQAGLGLEQMVAPSDNYRFNTLSAVHLGAGKQFNRYNSARMTFNLAWGYQQG